MRLKKKSKAIWLIYFTEVFNSSLTQKLVFFLHIFPTQKYKLVYFRYIQVSYEILELEENKKSEV